MKYVEWYVAGLEEMLERGGKQEDVDAVVAEVNNPTEKGLDGFLRRRGLPSVYLGMVPCGECGEPYAIDMDAKLNKEMVCASCVKTTNPS